MKLRYSILTGIAVTVFSLLNLSCSSTAANTFTIKGSATAAAAIGKNLRATTAGSPTSLSLTLYAVYISTNTDCTGAVLAGGDGTTAVVKDFVANPTLFTGSPAAGTYKCIILKMSDNMVFVPDATAVAAFPGVCVANTAATFDIYRDTDSGWKDKDGAVVTGHGTKAAPVSDIVSIFASTVPADVVAGAIGASSNQVVTLTSALVIPATGTFTGTFSADATNQVSSSSRDGEDRTNYCWLEKATFGFTGK